MLSRRTFLSSSAALAALSCKRETLPPGALTAMERGVSWLQAQQQADGSFRSTAFGLLSSGQSLSPFALYSLLSVPPQHVPWSATVTQSAAKALHDFMSPQGAVGLAGPVADYPVYATALSVAALSQLAPGALLDWARPMVDWLAAQQLGPEWAGHPAEGGFPMGGAQPPQPPDSGHVDLSMSRRALEALVLAGVQPLPSSRAFVERCRAADGGFIYSPVEKAVNKGGEGEEGLRGYGSATADGILALLALGATAQDPVVVKAKQRLQDMHRLDQNPGLEQGMATFAPAMRFYYRAVSAQVFERLGGPEGWQRSLVNTLAQEQRVDGRWENESALQKESEPIIATGFALQALGAAVRSYRS